MAALFSAFAAFALAFPSVANADVHVNVYDPQARHPVCNVGFYSGPNSGYYTWIPCVNAQNYANIYWATGAHEYVTVGTGNAIFSAAENGNWWWLRGGRANANTGSGISVINKRYASNGRVLSLTLRVYGTNGMYCLNGDGHNWDANWRHC